MVCELFLSKDVKNGGNVDKKYFQIIQDQPPEIHIIFFPISAIDCLLQYEDYIT
jgi:hypothetical protein